MIAPAGPPFPMPCSFSRGIKATGGQVQKVVGKVKMGNYSKGPLCGCDDYEMESGMINDHE